jgi:V/A-type H+-transporting ATPase subunit I
MFGGYFGDVVDVVSSTFFGHKVTIPALWFVPLNNPMRLLLYSLLFGLIHLFTGLGIKGYMMIRDGKYKDAIYDVGFWFLFLIGLLGMLIPSSLFASIAGMEINAPAWVNTGAVVLTVVGALGILLTAGRRSKNPALRLALGAYDIYNITGWLSDILSYSRLLALGLATGVIAQVVNSMASMIGTGVIGVIAFIIIFIIGHTLNLAINLLGAYVHTNRLQYVEFFGKFYEGGGRPFNPFKEDTKYIQKG